MSAELAVALATVCRLTDAPRSTVYARRSAEQASTVVRKRGPRTALSDDELTEKIKEVIRTTPFSGEGHRKVTARLRREHGIRVGRQRVLRLMRTAGLLAPQRARGRRKPRPHDGTIIPPAPNMLWGTDATMAYTVRDGWVWAFVAIDHHTDEAWASVARRGDRFAALEPIYSAVRDRFEIVDADAGPWGCHAPRLGTAVHLRALHRGLGVARDLRLTRLRGRATVQRVRRAVHPDPEGAVHLGEALPGRRRAA